MKQYIACNAYDGIIEASSMINSDWPRSMCAWLGSRWYIAGGSLHNGNWRFE